jgi:hypothetical protein
MENNQFLIGKSTINVPLSQLCEFTKGTIDMGLSMVYGGKFRLQNENHSKSN